MNKSGIAPNVISHPKGGGAISGIGESFSADLHTGTGNLTVPIGLPPGRNGFAPELSLAYSTGTGNGVFGLGWRLSVPGVTRDTSDGIPTYDDDADVFLLSGMERLVPVGGNRYRPRTEGAFARIERRGELWEVRTKSGLVSRYGATVRNPEDERQIFAWNLTETLDPFGNRIEYSYERDEVREQESHRWDQLRLAQIRYVDHGPREAPRFLVTVDFVYEDRPDPFSSYRSGFEIRSVRRCARIEVRTHADETRLARVYHFHYLDDRISLLKRIIVEGVDGDERETLPPLEFGYTAFRPEERVYQPVGGALPDRSLAHPDFDLADVFASGLPDIVEIGDEHRYWKNLGNGRFDLPRTFAGLPGVRLGDRGVTLADANGDGHIDLLLSTPAGYTPLTVQGRREPFVSYAAGPSFSLEDAEVRLLDLDGDGVTDALRTGASFELYYHDAEAGWTSAEVRARDRLDRFPNVYFSDPRVKLADMTGDGLTDIVFVDGDRVDYWPYLGRGRWAERVTMRGQLAFPDSQIFGGVGFDPKRLLLGDVDGDGLADLVYVESGRITVWLNNCGNGWSEAIVIHGTPPITEVDAVRLVDLNGTGTAGILWSYDAGTFADSSYKFLDLTGGVKPYLLNERDNHAGARTRIEYAPSTRFYLDDEVSAQTRWRSRLPFPVQVVSRIETIDELSRGKLTTEYRYHQGYWDGEEREFRGFGLVEQFDTETFARYHASGLHGDVEFHAVDEARFSPPTLTRTWFHQGEVVNAAGERSEPELSGPLSDGPVFLRNSRSELAAIAMTSAQTANPRRLHHALRALRGSVLRTELLALDGSPLQNRPYTVTESLYDVREIQHSELGVFLPLHIGTRTTHWERGADPMHRFSFTGEYDAYGQPRVQLDIAVPRGRDPLVTLSAPAERHLATVGVTEYAQRDDAERYVVDRVARTTLYEIANDGTGSVFALRAAVNSGTANLRVIGHSRTYFDGDAFVGLPLGQLGDFGAAVRRETLAFDATFLASTSNPPYLASQPTWSSDYPAEFREAIPSLAGYVRYSDNEVERSPSGYFVVTERSRYDFQSGAVPRSNVLETRDALGSATTIERDIYDMLPVRTTDAAGLTTEAAHDYRVLAARTLIDENGNSTEVRYSPAGFVVAQFISGKAGEGDATNPSLRFEYDLLAFATRGEPMSVREIRRLHHDNDSDIDASERDQTIENVQYSDGFGRVFQTRSQAETTLYGESASSEAGLPLDASQPNRSAIGQSAHDHVIVSGWQTYDNKGRVVEKYEPFFARGWQYGIPDQSERGQPITMFYDARGQLIRAVAPDGAETLVVPGIPLNLADPSAFAPTPWESFTYDANDNAGRTHRAVASAYDAHWNTPVSVVVDALGRAVSSTTRNGSSPAEWLTTRSTYDIAGNLIVITDALGRDSLRYTCDLLGRRWGLQSIDAGARETVRDALGEPIEERDGQGGLILRAYDVLHRATLLWARDDSSSPLLLRQRLHYGDQGTAAERRAARATNLLGKLVTQHDGAGVVRHHGFDFKGNLVEKSRRIIADDHLLNVFNEAPLRDWHIKPYATDWGIPPGQSLAERETALLESTVHETSARFDAIGRARLVRMPRDVDGRRRAIRPTYNRAGRLERVHVDEDLYVDRIAYNARAQRVLVALGNGVMTRYAYDPRSYRVVRVRSERFTRSGETTYAPGGNAIQDCTYAYDVAGNITATTERAAACGVIGNPDAAGVSDGVLAQLLSVGDAMIRRFSYDPMYRLRAATGRECDRPPAMQFWLDAPRCHDVTRTRAYTEAYRYDPVGNLVSLVHHDATGGFTRTYGFDSASNRLRTVTLGPSTTLEYGTDVNGNLAAESGARQFEWNYACELNVFRTQTPGAEPSVYAQYLYDAGGQRMKKLVRRQGGRVEVTHYIEAAFEYRRWYASSNTGENNYIHVLDGQRPIALVRIGAPQSGDTAPAIRFQLCDQVLNVNVVLDKTGAPVDREELAPFGETTFGSFAKKRFRFAGKERDEESSLSYHGARYYAPWLARWMSCDPAGPVGGASNLYVYGDCNPVNHVDTNGNEVESYWYTQTPGGQWWGYYMGTAAHVIIGVSFERNLEGEKIWANYFSVATILTKSKTGNPARLNSKESKIQPDITDTYSRSREVWEIKPGLNRDDSAAQAVLALQQVQRAVDALNKGADPGVVFKKGFGQGAPFNNSVYVSFPYKDERVLWRLTWMQTYPGAIQYQWQRSNSKSWRTESVQHAIAANQWIEVPLAEQQKYSEAMFSSLQSELKLDKTLGAVESTYAPVEAFGKFVYGLLLGAVLAPEVPIAPKATVPETIPEVVPPGPLPDIVPLPLKSPVPAPAPAVTLQKAA